MANSRKILIIGNGPSTQYISEAGFHNLRTDVDTFAMGAAYRFFRKINWWPTYFALGDPKTVFSHRTELAQLTDDPNIKTRRFYFSWPVAENKRIELIEHCSTGDFCLKKSIELNYREIYLIGIEGDYVEEIPESRPITNSEYTELGLDQLNLAEQHRTTLRIIHTTPEHNPNYFFPEYQQVGDIYSLPQSKKHRRRWKGAAQKANTSRVRVLNLSPTSKIDYFPKTHIQTVFRSLFNDMPKLKNIDKPFASPNNFNNRSETIYSSFWFGPFERSHEKRVDEAQIVFELFQSGHIKRSRKPTMIDVGACRGGACHNFAEQRWAIHAFEPNKALLNDLNANFKSSNVTIINAAVSDSERDEAPFFTSRESIGISSLQAFRPSHELTAHVKTITLNSYLKTNNIAQVDFLKIDTEGFDLMVLKGLDLGRFPTEVILCEFEDVKTEALGYHFHDLAAYLTSFGYTVYSSEWHPVLRYGGLHQWRILKQYPCELEETQAWGNFLAFRTDPGIEMLTWEFNRNIERFEKRNLDWAIEQKFPCDASTEEKLEYAKQMLRASQERIQMLENQLSSIYASTSWQITAPLRSCVDTFRQFLRSRRGK